MSEKPKVHTRYWWALLKSPDSLPVLFTTRKDAAQNRDPDEYLELVKVSRVISLKGRKPRNAKF